MADHDNFVFKKRINSNKQSIIASKQKSRLNKRKRAPSNVTAASPLPIFDTTNLPPILNKYKICIFKNLNLLKLKPIAEGMGAQVSTELTKTTSHLIIEPKGDQRQLKVVNQAVSKGIICASPKWLLACYSEKRLCPPTAYQYDIDENTHTLDSSQNASVIPPYNPFNTSYVDFDTLEREKPLTGGQLRMDGFLHRNTEPETPFKTQIDTQEQEQEEHVAAEEFYYNSASSSAVTVEEETEQEKEAKRLKAQQRNMEMEKALEQRRSLLNEQNRVKTEVSLKKRRVVSNTYGERLKVWYGEQPFQQETVKKKR